MVRCHYDQIRLCRTEKLVEEQPMQQLVSLLAGESGTTVESDEVQDSATVLTQGKCVNFLSIEQSTVPVDTDCELHHYTICLRKTSDRLEL